MTNEHSVNCLSESAFETASGVPGVLLGGVDGMHWPTIPKASY
jgi:hypothetical protein